MSTHRNSYTGIKIHWENQSFPFCMIVMKWSSEKNKKIMITVSFICAEDLFIHIHCYSTISSTNLWTWKKYTMLLKPQKNATFVSRYTYTETCLFWNYICQSPLPISLQADYPVQLPESCTPHSLPYGNEQIRRSSINIADIIIWIVIHLSHSSRKSITYRVKTLSKSSSCLKPSR